MLHLQARFAFSLRILLAFALLPLHTANGSRIAGFGPPPALPNFFLSNLLLSRRNGSEASDGIPNNQRTGNVEGYENAQQPGKKF
jgi:hypothetical protein